MCRRVQCQKCQKPTYAGCGMHIEQVLADVPVDERCTCREELRNMKKSSGERSLFRRIFGG